MAENPLEKIAKAYFESEVVVDHYFRVGHRIGLWESEKRIIQDTFRKDGLLLDLGCGTGRIAFGMEALGYIEVRAVDYSKGMIEAARLIAEGLGSRVNFRCDDARRLSFEASSFDGVIFGFNGLFMIPKESDRRRALAEIFRILKPGGRFICTGHDRGLVNQREYWESKGTERSVGGSKSDKSDFGDVVAETELGKMFIHSTTEAEAHRLLKGEGFIDIQSKMRRELANEDSAVRQFSDECRFWRAMKPLG
jgi:SAM-dependent methyltransferase